MTALQRGRDARRVIRRNLLGGLSQRPGGGRLTRLPGLGWRALAS